MANDGRKERKRGDEKQNEGKAQKEYEYTRCETILIGRTHQYLQYFISNSWMK